jgi:hypothetical protein
MLVRFKKSKLRNKFYCASICSMGGILVSLTSTVRSMGSEENTLQSQPDLGGFFQIMP